MRTGSEYMIYVSPKSENDAIFLPASMRKGKTSLHGCEDELYIISYNPNADNYNGDFEIKIIDKITVSKLCKTVSNYFEFFEYLPMFFEGKWQYASRNDDNFGNLFSLFNTADFIVSRDGDINDEFEFIKNWVQT